MEATEHLKEEVEEDSVLTEFIVGENNQILPTQLNPWSVRSVSEFLYYCCPECDVRTRNLKAFVKHARKKHFLVRYSCKMTL